MSRHDRATAALLTQLMMAADGVLFGVSIAYVAFRSIRKYVATSSALRKVRDSPSVQLSDLRSVLSDDSPKLVIVRGSVEVFTSEKVNWKSLMEISPVASNDSGDKYVIVQRTQTVPFVLVEGKKWPHSDYVFVNMEGSNHPLPLTTAYQHLQPISSSPYTFLQALCGLEYPIGMLYEEKILPLRKDITAIGICYPKNGAFEIKSCKDLPYFLSALTKDQIVADLSFRTKVLMWSGLILGTVSLGILGYSVGRNWNRWKEYRRQRRTQQQNNSISTASDISADVVVDEEPEEISDGELCVICQTRRRRSAFVPCGHLVCCPRCALSVERVASPKCP